MNRVHAAALTMMLVLGSMTAGATESFDITINTSPLNLVSGYLAFDFLGGDPVEGNSVAITNFSSDAKIGTLTATGAASGSIVNGTGVLEDSQFFNELLQGVTYGNTISFELSLTTLVANSGTPDEFSFYLLDSGQDPYQTSDPTGADSLFSININAAKLLPLIYTSNFATVTIKPAGVAPEPESGWLLAVGILAFAVWRAKRTATLQARLEPK